MSKEEIVVNWDKVKAILQASTPTNVKALSRFLAQIRWHSQIALVLKQTLPHYMPCASIIVSMDALGRQGIPNAEGDVITGPGSTPLDWTKGFHVFVDASNVAIVSVLMQLTKLKWYRKYNTRVGSF